MRRPHTSGAVLVGAVLGCLAALAASSPVSADGRCARRYAGHVKPSGDDPGEINTGNGKHNRSIADVRSPVLQRGNQHTSTENLSGVTNVQSALCRYVRVCHITLQVVLPPSKDRHKVTITQETSARENDGPDGTAVGREEECCCVD